MKVLTIIEREDRLVAAHRQLRERLLEGAEIVLRNVNFPGPLDGYSQVAVSSHPREDFWAYLPEQPRSEGEKRRYCCFLGSEIEKSTLVPAVEINVGTHRHPAGRMLVDTDGVLYVGHRGRLGGGRRNIGFDEFHSAAEASGFSRLQARRDSMRDLESVILLGTVDGAAFVERLGQFVRLCRKLRSEHANPAGKSP